MKKNQSVSNVFIYFSPNNKDGNADKFTYRVIEASETGKIAEKFGDYITRFKCLHFGEGCLTIGAFLNNEPVGIISVYMRFLPAPLEDIRETVIDILEVDKVYRRQGIARELVARVEQWAKDYRALQIRTWCSGEKSDYIKAMYSLGYCMCPVKIWVDSRKEEAGGYYAVKPLNSEVRTFL
jgi:GNAT superfamily N-acetyltransferase